MIFLTSEDRLPTIRGDRPEITKSRIGGLTIVLRLRYYRRKCLAGITSLDGDFKSTCSPGEIGYNVNRSECPSRSRFVQDSFNRG